jgi:hypothetical protein
MRTAADFRAFLLVTALAGGCATSAAPADPAAPFSPAEAPPGPTTPATPQTESQRAACRTARDQLQTALDAAASGCTSDDDCELFQTCTPVMRIRTSELWALHDQAQKVCPHPSGDNLRCVAASARCVEGSCARPGDRTQGR